MIILVVEPNKNPYPIHIEDNLESMQKIVGGLIQAVYPFDDEVALICNEEGKLLGLPINRLLIHNGVVKDVIMGTFFLCGCPPYAESFISLTDEQIKKYSEIYWL